MDLVERPGQATSRHPWEQSRFRFFARVLRDSSAMTASRVLDAGAGDAWFSQNLLPSLSPRSEITCWDANYTPDLLTSLAASADPRVRFVTERPQGRFDLVLMLDVLEHVEHDADFLGGLVRDNLADDGTVLLSVPAWPQLFTMHDRRLRHFRRYVPSDAATLIERAGLTIVRRGGLFHSLLIPRAIGKLRERFAPAASHDDQTPPALEWHGGSIATRLIGTFLAADGEISRMASSMPVELPGLSWWALCKKQ